MIPHAAVIAGFAGCLALSSFGVNYSVEVLPSHGGAQSLFVTDMNDSGWLTGYYQDGSYFKSVVWHHGQWEQIPGFSTKSSFSYAINNAGTVAGQSDRPTFLFGGFSFQNGSITDETPANRAGSVLGINDAGVLCGFAHFNGIGTRAFIKNNGSFRLLGSLGGSATFPFAINGSNQVAGRSTTASGVAAAFIHADSLMRSIAPAGATFSSAEAINDLGQAVGRYRCSQGNRGFYFDGYQSFDVGSIPGAIEMAMVDINNAGTAVGYGYIDENNSAAVKYECGNLIDLGTLIEPSSPMLLGAALAINNLGWIAVLASEDGVTGVTAILRPLP